MDSIICGETFDAKNRDVTFIAFLPKNKIVDRLFSSCKEPIAAPGPVRTVRSQEALIDMGCDIRNLSNLSEDVLVHLAQHRDREAFQELVARAQDTCMRLATRILRNREDAADEVQNAVCKAYTHIETFAHDGKFSTWIARIVINHCYMRFRRANRVRFVSYESSAGDGTAYQAHEPVNVHTPELLLGRAEVIQLLRYEVRHIPHKLRFPLELHYIDGVPLDQVANRLGLTVAATKSRLHRAQSFLRDRMLRHCGTRGVGTLTRATAF